MEKSSLFQGRERRGAFREEHGKHLVNTLGMWEEFSTEGGSGGSQRRVQMGCQGTHALWDGYAQPDSTDLTSEPALIPGG